MNQKGFASILVIGIIVVVIAIGTGGYFYVSKQSEENQTKNQAANEPAEAVPALENEGVSETTTTQKQESKTEIQPETQKPTTVPAPTQTPAIAKEPVI